MNKSQKTFKNLTLVTLLANIPYVLSLIISLFAPSSRGSEAFMLFVPIILIGWCYAAVYLFYFPYYMTRYRQSDTFTRIGTGVFAAIVLVVVGMLCMVLFRTVL